MSEAGGAEAFGVYAACGDCVHHAFGAVIGQQFVGLRLTDVVGVAFNGYVE